ncbi:MAG: tRNA-dihydrouridine synthase family protein [Desulfovibrio sp.]|jgi:tRNA-dihydrouridine synthase B|nr:tRNA-dihydrouridine synthase family protein [Desulfovibrio sp.]
MSACRLPLGPESPWLAPLAGFTDLPFRLLCREQGAAVACTEMISAKGLVFGARARRGDGGGSFGLLATRPEDAPLVVQIFGAEAEYLGEAVRMLLDRGFSWFDLNMGCPVPKVTKTGAGAALLKNPSRALACARAMLAAAPPGRVGVKLRLGWEEPVLPELGRALEEAGAGWLSLHPRSARQGFSGAVREEALGELAAAVSIPVLASGDLFSAEDGLARLGTGVAGVMFARGALRDPAIFARYRAALRGVRLPDPLGPENLRSLIRRHLELAQALSSGRAGKRERAPGMLKMRAIVPRYIRHLPGARRLRGEMVRCESWERLRALVEEFFHGCDP